jgi:hypothetical protein
VSIESVDKTLVAVEQALSHFVGSLDRAGFGSAANEYTKMSEIVAGQCLWAVQHDVTDLGPRFRTVANLASRISSTLEPYVAAMRRLEALDELAPSESAVEEALGEDAAAVLEAVTTAERPVSLTRIRTSVAMPSSQLREVLDDLRENGWITDAGTRGRPLYRATTPAERMQSAHGHGGPDGVRRGAARGDAR